jgi:Protein of unknown function (DUF1236)
MKTLLNLAASGLAIALATSAASAQTGISQSITAEPVETTVMQTPTGTIVTRRPLGEQPAALVAPQVAAPAFAQPVTIPAATFVDTAPESVDVFTTRQVVRRAQAEREARPMVTRQVSSPSAPAARRTHARRVSTTVRPPPAVQRTTRVVRETRPIRETRQETRRAALTQPAPRLVLNPRERQIVYRTIVEREVIPRQQVIVAPSAVPAPAYVAPRVLPPIVAADETVVTTPIRVGTVLPANVPLYAMPQNVALTVPATQSYSYAWLGGRAYLVDPASGVVMTDLSE